MFGSRLSVAQLGMTGMDDVLKAAAQWIGEGRKVALGTVVKTWGSSPRPTGSQIAVRDDGAFVGSVSGGCVEGAVIAEARAAMEDGKTRTARVRRQRRAGLGASGSPAAGASRSSSSRSPDAMRRETLRTLNEMRRAGRAVVRATDLATGDDRLIDPYTDRSPLGLAAAEAARADQSGSVEIEGRAWFLAVFNPPLDLVVVGAAHIAQPLTQMRGTYGLPRPRHRSAPGLRDAAALSRCRALARLARRGACQGAARAAQRARGAHPRSQGRRSGADRGAGARTVSTSARWARRRPMPADSRG